MFLNNEEQIRATLNHDTSPLILQRQNIIWNLEPGTWNLEPGTWNLEPGTSTSPPPHPSQMKYHWLFLSSLFAPTAWWHRCHPNG
jgi:hypothetical protein